MYKRQVPPENVGTSVTDELYGGVAIQKGPEYHENGSFAWVMDPEGNKVELWEPKLWDEKNKNCLLYTSRCV